jgi:pSer/pThr/pTyr-binding forkhead associated (FHA) protein
VQEPLSELHGRGRPVLVAEGKRRVIAPGGAVIGRSRDCDVVLADSNVSRRHAEIRPSGSGAWTIVDLGSTNGVRRNGHPVHGTERLEPGDHLTLGTVDASFEVE